MCDAWITKLPHCDVEECLDHEGMLAEGIAQGCLPEAITCLESRVELSEGCAGGCDVQEFFECIE